MRYPSFENSAIIPIQADAFLRVYAERMRLAMERSRTYAPPVDQLLTFGEEWSKPDDWPDYLALGLGSEHIPDLIRMATNEELEEADDGSAEVWAPIHARRALGQLQARPFHFGG